MVGNDQNSEPEEITDVGVSDGLVALEDACPNCGERGCDQLIWLDDEHVECQCCKKVYSPRGTCSDSAN